LIYPLSGATFMDKKLTHLNETGQADMVDVGHKPASQRLAIAEGYVQMQADTLELIQAGNLKKGDVVAIARIAGIMAAKRTADLIPLCHPLPLDKISVEITPQAEHSRIRIQAEARTTGKTGVEMEALTAVNVAALTIYDMAKAVDRAMVISGVRLLEKRGGIHGDYLAEADTDGS
jgi:cyclic pyranopterin monophosphate synthase